MITLGIDNGTQSTKVIALDGDSTEVLAQSSRGYGLIPGLPEGHLEQNPADWITAAEVCIADVLGKLGKRVAEIAAIGVSGQQHGFVPLDRKGQVIRPAKLWCDTSTVQECESFRRHFGGSKRLIELIGNDILPGFTASKILWLKKHEPENFSKLAHILLPHDYLNYWLTGNYFMEYGDASGTALMDIRSRRWSAQICDFIDPGVLSKLPPLSSSHDSAGTLRPELALKWGLDPNVRVSAGGGDNMMGAIGTGNISPGIVTASLGTSGTIYAYANHPVIDPRGEISAFCDSTEGWLPLVCTMNVTGATEAVRKNFQWDYKQLDEAVRSVEAGADGLHFLPYLLGERTPNLPAGRGVLSGLTMRNFTPAHQARAVMEGVTLGLAYGLKRLGELGIKPTSIRLTGGGSRSPVWRQICADVFACPVVTLQSAEGAALGAAVQALALVQSRQFLINRSHDIHAHPAITIGKPSQAPSADQSVTDALLKDTMQKTMAQAQSVNIIDHLVKVNSREEALPIPGNVKIYQDLLVHHLDLTKRLFQS